MAGTAIHIERHDVGAPEFWQSSLVHVTERREGILKRAPRPQDASALLDCDLETAALLSALGRPSDEIAVTMARGAAAGAAGAMAQAASAGFVLLREPGTSGPRCLPAGPVGMTPLRWRDALMLSLVVRDRASSQILLDPDRINACQLGIERADAFWPAYCHSLAAVVQARPGARDEIERVLAAMQSVEIADPAVLAALDRPLLHLAAALADRPDDLTRAAADALKRHHDWYAEESRRLARSGFLAVGILGLCALTHDRGATIAIESLYAPQDLIIGATKPPLSIVARAFGGVEGEAVEDVASALAAAELLKQLLRPQLMALRGADARGAAMRLRPRAEDYTKAFISEAVADARDKYEALWRAPPPFPAPDPLRTDLRIHLAPAGFLADDNMLSRHFPSGYHAVASKLVPERIWAAWEFVAPGRDTGLAFDGLVWCDDHWSWFPRPYQILSARR